MYVYNELFDAKKSALIYPGEYQERHGQYYGREGNPSGRECSAISLDVDGDIRKWQENIVEIILNWLAGDSSNRLKLFSKLSEHFNRIDERNI